MSKTITLDHGSGGKASHDLIEQIFLTRFDSKTLHQLEDSALLQIGDQKLAFSTDSFVVDPIFFPGGCIGDLSVNGTVNDLVMRGARPLYLSVGLILEEGLPLDDLKKIVDAMHTSAKQAGVQIVAGDTKVVPKGKCDKIFINTTGIGVLENNFDISGANAQPGDHVILSGTMADHGVTILCKQEGLEITGDFTSDSASLNHMAMSVLDKHGKEVHVMRDPTRGGVATTLNEIAASSKIGIELVEDDLPVRPDVSGACELLGLEPLYLANEGKMLLFVTPESSQNILEILHQHELGKQACVIGKVTSDNPGKVVMKSGLGTTRLIDMLQGKPLPRIC